MQCDHVCDQLADQKNSFHAICSDRSRSIFHVLIHLPWFRMISGSGLIMRPVSSRCSCCGRARGGRTDERLQQESSLWEGLENFEVPNNFHHKRFYIHHVDTNRTAWELRKTCLTFSRRASSISIILGNEILQYMNWKTKMKMHQIQVSFDMRFQTCLR